MMMIMVMTDVNSMWHVMMTLMKCKLDDVFSKVLKHVDFQYHGMVTKVFWSHEC